MKYNGSFSRLGVINGLGRELPYLLGRGNKEQALNLSSTSLYYALSSNLILLALVPIILYSDFYNYNDKRYFFALFVFIGRILFSSYTAYLSVTFRTSKNFEDLSNIQVALGILKLFSVLFVYLYGFYGLLFRELLMSIIEMIFYHWKRPLNIMPYFSWKALKHLMSIGFPLFAVSYLFTFADTLPRLYIIKFGRVSDLGLFSPIIVTLGLAMILPNAIGSYMYPKMSYEFGLTGDKNKLWKIVKLTVLSSLFAGIFLFVSIFFLSQYVEILFPDYTNIEPYLRLVSFGLIFVGYKASGLVFSVLKAWKAMFFNAGFYIMICLISLLFLHIIYDDILKVASLSIVFSYSASSIVAFYLAYRLTRKN